MQLTMVWTKWCRVWAGAIGRSATESAPDHIRARADSPAQESEHWGCGWFDSSFELRTGLAVIEEGGDELRAAVEWLLQSARPTAA